MRKTDCKQSKCVLLPICSLLATFIQNTQNCGSEFIPHALSYPIKFVVLLLILIAATSPSFSLGEHLKTIDAEDKEFARLKKEGKEYLAAGQISEAIQCFKKAADTPHYRDYSQFKGLLLGVLSKAPTNPDAHIALGIDYMNLLDLRFCRDPKNFLGDGQEAEWEFRTATSLSPHGKNAEAEALLSRLEDLRKSAADHDSHFTWYGEFKARKPFLGLLLTSQWKPPDHGGFLITRLCTSGFSKELNLVVASGSSVHDNSALKALRECLQDFPNLYWGHRDFIFVSGGGAHIAEEECPGSVIIPDPLMSGKPQKDEDVIAKAFFELYFTMERIRDYCKPDTQYAYKCGVWQLQAHPDAIVTGVLNEYSSEFGGPITWTCAVVAGKPVCYELSIGYKWSIVIDPEKMPTDKDFDNFILAQRIRDALFSCLINYEVKHFSELSNGELLSRQPSGVNTCDGLVRNEQGIVNAYKCVLKDGRAVTAELNQDHSITSVAVDGKSDKLWTAACQQALANMQSSLGCGPMPIIPGRDVEKNDHSWRKASVKQVYDPKPR